MFWTKEWGKETGTMMGSLGYYREVKGGRSRGGLSLQRKIITFNPGSYQHFLIIAHLHVSLDVKLKEFFMNNRHVR